MRWLAALSGATLLLACNSLLGIHDLPSDATPTPIGDDSGPAADGPAVDGAVCKTGSMTYAYTGAPVMLTLPDCVTTIDVDLSGAAGGAAASVGDGGLGARVQGSLSIAASSTITVYVGGVGGTPSISVSGLAGLSLAGSGGFNGGGDGGAGSNESGAGGGGASDIRIGGADLVDRVFVAAGGGGASTCQDVGFDGGSGGGTSGGEATMACGVTTFASGGTQTAGGAGGTYPGDTSGSPGTLGVGGLAGNGTGGGGGGGGYYGGGGGSWTGGAGGSSFAASGATNIVETAGYRAGAGIIKISY